MPETELDRTDRTILAALQQDGRMANVALAARVNLSESACLRRVRALEQAGVIDRYVALLSQPAVGLPDSVFVEVSLTREQQKDLDAFENAVRKLPEVMECYLMSGEYDYLLRVVVANTADYERIHRENITRLPGVARVRSGFALRTVTKHTDLPIRQKS
ncbi:MAG: AsnC family transcriptional regulator [Gammaproteobacteria bacterium RIFCSPLOWO2_02_FULL_61_13]|nr:MAG: AsnC family transcriptional regulator [Gammaproteobacteria bacterium RIFCSPLOWO2_02_FULL_61_13]